jgi:hypothetical protein
MFALSKPERGHGRWKFPAGEYDGEWEGGVMHGRGVYRENSGHIYEGEYHRGMKHGKGVRKDSDGVITYEGEYARGEICGYGKQSSSQGATYEGEFVAGEWWGHGALTFTNGIMVEGRFESCKLHGKCKVSQPGIYSVDCEYSRGRCVAGSGWKRLGAQGETLYEGQFSDDGNGLPVFHGSGVLTTPTWKYEGEFRQGLFNGHGKADHPGLMYTEGQFVGGKLHGRVYKKCILDKDIEVDGCKFSWNAGDSAVCEYKENKRHGECT